MSKSIVGIYCIENVSNGKKYIGQSNYIKARFRQHKSKLQRNCHPNILLQNAWNKYGSDSFKFYIIEECSAEQLNEKEMYYINKYDTYGKGYNLSVGGDPGVNSRGKRIKQYDLDGNFIKTWDNAAEASRFFNVDRSQITYAVRHHRTMYGYQSDTGDDRNWVNVWGNLSGSSQEVLDCMSGKTVKIVISQDGNTTSIYLDDDLIGTQTGVNWRADSSNGTMSFGSGADYTQSSGDQCYNLKLTGLRIYETEG